MWPAAAGGTAVLWASQTHLMRFYGPVRGREEGVQKTFTAISALGYKGSEWHIVRGR